MAFTLTTPASGRPPESADQLAAKVAVAAEQATGVHHEQIMGPRRHDRTAFVRQLCMWLLRRNSYGLQEIALAFKRRDHGTVMHACQKVDHLLKLEQREAHQPVRALLIGIAERAQLSTPGL